MLPLTLQICQRRNEGGWTIDHECQLGTYITKNDLWASFNDVIDIEEKCDWILKRELGGASVFMLADDDWHNLCGCGKFPLLRTINRKLRKNNSTHKHCSILNNTIEYYH